MPYNVLPNIIFILAILGIAAIVLRRLPEAVADQNEAKNPEGKLAEKGLPARSAVRSKMLLKLWARRAWNFILEAKDLRHGSLVGYRIRKASAPPPDKSSGVTLAGAEHTTTPLGRSQNQSESEILELIRREPKDLEHYHTLGLYYLNHRAFKDATDIFEYLVSHDPANAEYLHRLGFSYYKTGRFSEAAKRYEESLSLDSSQPKRYYNLGVAQESLGKYQEAILAFEHAANLDPQNVRYQLALADATARTGNTEQAKAVLREAQARFPGNQDIQDKLTSLA